MQNRIISSVAIGIALLFTQCSPVAWVKPLEKGKWAGSASLGGPLIGFGESTIPVPFTTVGAGYGLTETTTVGARVHTTSLLFGVAHVEASCLKQWMAPAGYRPGITTGIQTSFLMDRWEKVASLYPQVDWNAYWNVGTQGSMLYTGATTYVELRKYGVMGRSQPHRVVLAFHVGYRHQWNSWGWNAELKYLAPGVSNQNLVVDYKSIGNTGTVGVWLGLIKMF